MTGNQVEEQLRRGADLADELLEEQTRQRNAVTDRPGVLIAEGDSWFDYPRYDIVKRLERQHGWDVESVAHYGDNLEGMAYDRAQLDPLTRAFIRVRGRGEVPRGLLLSGGGNDFAGPELAMLLDHAGSGHGGVNDIIRDELVQVRLKEAWAHLLGFTTRLGTKQFGAPVRTVVHGYAYPWPDGRPFLDVGPFEIGPWLAPSYARKGLGSNTREGLEERRALTIALMDKYNEMLARLVEEPGLEHVVYVDLRNILTSPDYRDDWDNELHPTRSGFDKIALEIHDAVVATQP